MRRVVVEIAGSQNTVFTDGEGFRWTYDTDRGGSLSVWKVSEEVGTNLNRPGAAMLMIDNDQVRFSPVHWVKVYVVEG